MRIYKANEVDNQRFFQVPKSLFNNDKYKKMSLESKMVYAVLRDRMELSRKNGWVTDNQEIYLLYSRENLSELIGCSEQTIRKSMKQLIDHKLISEKRQGQGKANIIFVCHVEQTLENAKTDIIYSSRTSKNNSLNLSNISPSDTNYSETDKLRLNNDNGTVFNKTCTRLEEPLKYRKEINETRRYFVDCYESTYRENYHRHKAEQNKYIDEQLNNAFSEFGLEYDNMSEMINNYFDQVDCDHNLMHFVSEGIIRNRVYEVS